MTRRAFLAVTAATALTPASARAQVPRIGLHLQSVARALSSDRTGTLRAVAAMGYGLVEVHADYLDWTVGVARDVRALLDDEGLRCVSTHNGAGTLAADTLRRAAELNQTLGSPRLVLTSPPDVTTLDGWRAGADRIRTAADTLQALDLATGFQPVTTEWIAVGGRLPIDVLIANVPPRVSLQLDVGRCVAAGADPMAFINVHPNRVTSLHLREWAPSRPAGATEPLLLGEGIVPWQQVFGMAEMRGGAEHYLIARDDHPQGLEAAERDLSAYRAMRGIA
jgi:sugar phosphate isomerase/epimerase